MAIPESQLDTWSNQGATSQSAATYAQVQRAFSTPTSRVRARDHEIYLQGSYKNDTNVRGDSDVDVIAQVNEVFYHDLVALDADQRQRYEASRSPASYSWEQFRSDVLHDLRAYFGTQAVVERNKCITVLPAPGRLSTDVVAAAQLRRYTRFISWADERHHTGIVFWTQRENRRVENWPKQHYANGVTKNATTHARYKSTVRMFKNARAAAIDRGYLSEDEGPSYFVECLIYNVLATCFEPTKQGTYVSTVNWLQAQDKQRFVCGSELVWLFGPTPEQWEIPSADRVIDAWVRLWNEWR